MCADRNHQCLGKGNTSNTFSASCFCLWHQWNAPLHKKNIGYVWGHLNLALLFQLPMEKGLPYSKVLGLFWMTRQKHQPHPHPSRLALTVSNSFDLHCLGDLLLPVPAWRFAAYLGFEEGVHQCRLSQPTLTWELQRGSLQHLPQPNNGSRQKEQSQNEEVL